MARRTSSTAQPQGSMRPFLGICLLLGLCAAASAAPVNVSPDGSRLLDDHGRELVLRGANWGWWGCVVPEDARLIRDRGGNLIRIAFYYTKIVEPGTDTLGGEGLALLDRMVRWCEEAGVWYVLDCHEPPGGCNTAPYVFGGLNRLWRDAADQDRFVAMWDQLARRYRGGRHLLAYELMNEPAFPEGYSPDEHKPFCLRLIDTLRARDPGRLIVVSGPGWSDVSSLTPDLLLPRERLIYTFHFYNPGSITHQAAPYPGTTRLRSRWIGNSPERWGATGDTGWQTLERTFTAPAQATHGIIMLRSDTNAGTAWFDDVALLCDGVALDLPANAAFDSSRREEGWRMERQTAGEFVWDGEEGSAAPGSLRISGTDSYNAWTSTGEFPARPGAGYTLRCRVRTRAATGWTYPSVAWFEDTDATVDRQWLADYLRQARRFSRRYHVPVWCGEFGCSQSSPDGSGLRWVRDAGELLNDLRIPWTYWNWRETLGPGSMAAWVQVDGRYTEQRPLGELLQELWRSPEGRPPLLSP